MKHLAVFACDLMSLPVGAGPDDVVVEVTDVVGVGVEVVAVAEVVAMGPTLTVETLRQFDEAGTG